MKQKKGKVLHDMTELSFMTQKVMYCRRHMTKTAICLRFTSSKANEEQQTFCFKRN